MSSQRSEAEPWRSERVLRGLYQDEWLSISEMAEEMGCSETTVCNWMDRYGIERRDLSHPDEPWRDEKILRRLYCEEELSASEIARKFDCSRPTVHYWMDKFDIPRRGNGGTRREYVSYNVSGDYARWFDWISGKHVAVHQLLAIADGADPHEVFDPDTVCHHSTHHPRDNRPGVIEVMSPSEHATYHHQQEVPEWKRELIQWDERVNSAAEVDW